MVLRTIAGVVGREGTESNGLGPQTILNVGVAQNHDPGVVEILDANSAGGQGDAKGLLGTFSEGRAYLVDPHSGIRMGKES